MALTPNGLANAITTQQGVATADPATQTKANLDLATAIVNYLIASGVITVTIPPAAIATSGTAVAQSGPPSPVPLTGNIS